MAKKRRSRSRAKRTRLHSSSQPRRFTTRVTRANKVARRSVRSPIKKTYRKIRYIATTPARVRSKLNLKTAIISNTIGAMPHTKALICAKRKIRKEVLHAKNKNGINGLRKKKFTSQSKIKC